MEGALVRGLVADHERHLLFVEAHAGFVDAAILHEYGALREPVVLGHTAHQNLFRGGRGPVLVFEIGDKLVELVLIFAFGDKESAGEAELDAIADEMALPSSVFAPVENCALILLGDRR